MDCSEFERMVTGDPSTADGEVHLDACARCRDFVASIQSVDMTLESAMAISVPALKMPELPEIESEKVVSLDTRRRLRTPVWLALAATFAFAAVIGVRGFLAPGDYLSLDDEILAHMSHEPYSRTVTTAAVSEDRLRSVVPASMANLSADTGLITYAQSCEINGHLIPHLVIQGENGPVTILLLPNERIDAARMLEGNGFNGVLLPVGNGSIAIIGENEDPESLRRIQQRLTNSVSWTT